MRAICVDDEPLVLQLTVSLCRELSQLSEVTGFTDSQEALDYVRDNSVELALLDIDMPDMTGMELAKEIRTRSPRTAIIFLTGYKQYALDAFDVHASGYLLKPVSRDKLAAEVAYALASKPQVQPGAHIVAHTFGVFDLYVDGTPVIFARAKSKELLAYLIDRQGSTVTRANIFAVLWEEGQYDRSKQKYLDVIIRSLRETLTANGIEDIIYMSSGYLRVVPEKLDCDLYRFLAGDEEVRKEYLGEYMSNYSWAAVTEGYLDTLSKEQ